MTLFFFGASLASAQLPFIAGRSDQGGALIFVWDLASRRQRFCLEDFSHNVL